MNILIQYESHDFVMNFLKHVHHLYVILCLILLDTI